jgi:uncharacterized protein
MRLHSARIPKLAKEMVSPLLKDGDIEAESPGEVEMDIVAVLNQYMRDEQAVSDRAKEILAQRGLPQGEFGRIKKLVADERKIKIGEEAIDYVLDQLVEMLMHSANVGEVFVEDYVLRRKMRDPLRRLTTEEDELQAEVRAQLKHVKEGSSVWEVEYRRMMEEIKRRKGL